VGAYLPLFTLFVLATLFAALSFLASSLLGPRKPTAVKSQPYECGIVPTREPAERFPVRFYLVAMIFVIFDIEIVFAYPWAVIFADLRLFGLIEMVVFAVAVFVSFLYLIANGALDWGPSRRAMPTGYRGVGAAAPTSAAVPSGRTSSSTIRRLS